MAIITKSFPTSNGTVAQGSDVATNFDTIYNDYNGNITNANLSASAGITDDRLSAISTFGKVLGTSLSTLAGISASAGLIPTKNGGLNNDLSGATLGSLAYFSSAGTGSYLASGTSGYFLMSTGTTALPVYNDVIGKVLDYGTSSSSSTAKTTTLLKICFGRISGVSSGASQAITNLPFSGATSYSVSIIRLTTDTTNRATGSVTLDSGSQFTITNTSGETSTIFWQAIGW